MHSKGCGSLLESFQPGDLLQDDARELLQQRGLPADHGK